MKAESLDSGAPQILPSNVAVSIGAAMYSLFFWFMYGVRSYSHFCEANSAVQMTSEENTSQSPDLACWRWMNWLRCSSAEAGNSTSLAFRSGPYFLLNSSIM